MLLQQDLRKPSKGLQMWFSITAPNMMITAPNVMITTPNMMPKTTDIILSSKQVQRNELHKQLSNHLSTDSSLHRETATKSKPL